MTPQNIPSTEGLRFLLSDGLRRLANGIVGLSTPHLQVMTVSGDSGRVECYFAFDPTIDPPAPWTRTDHGTLIADLSDIQPNTDTNPAAPALAIAGITPDREILILNLHGLAHLGLHGPNRQAVARSLVYQLLLTPTTTITAADATLIPAINPAPASTTPPSAPCRPPSPSSTATPLPCRAQSPSTPTPPANSTTPCSPPPTAAANCSADRTDSKSGAPWTCQHRRGNNSPKKSIPPPNPSPSTRSSPTTSGLAF